jgi:hypothetical protein
LHHAENGDLGVTQAGEASVDASGTDSRHSYPRLRAKLLLRHTQRLDAIPDSSAGLPLPHGSAALLHRKAVSVGKTVRPQAVDVTILFALKA